MATKGIDVSKHQKKIDWAKVKASGKVSFAILRAGLGRLASQKDERFEENYAGAKAAGIPVGAFWYSYALTADEARKEADACIEVLKGKQLEYPVYFDVEEKSQLGLGKAALSAIVRAFCERVEAAGYWVGIYMSASPLSTLIADDVRQRFTVWVAHVGVNKPAYSGSYGMWQYTWTGRVTGINGDVDCDECYADFPAMIKAKGLNGFDKPSETPAEPEKHETKEVVLEMDGETWKGTLTKQK